MAATVTAQLRANFASPADVVRAGTTSTQNFEAWEAYQRGQELAGKSDSLAVAEQYFRKAIDADPRFAPAYLELAHVLIAQVYTRGARRDVNFAQAESALETALQLDPNLAEAWIVSAEFKLDRGEEQVAEAMYRKAIEIDPNSAPAYEKLSDLMWEYGRTKESLRYAEKALALDPLSIGVNQGMARSLEFAGRQDEAEALFRHMVEIDPSAPGPYMFLAAFEAYTRNRFANAVTLGKRPSSWTRSTPTGSGSSPGCSWTSRMIGERRNY